ncbi:1-acyl-sn-glycerol-3-phosphate acyltransferase [Arenibacterium sp. CAU 1754]
MFHQGDTKIDYNANRPLNGALRERLHLGESSTLSLFLVRMALHSVDAASRLLTHDPFFALRESEALLDRLGGVKGAHLIREILMERGGTMIVPHGLERIPVTGPVVIAATHPTGMFDFLAHAGALLDLRPDLRVVANHDTEQFLGQDMLIPVKFDKNNRAVSAAETQRAMQHHLEIGGALLIFGSGRVPKRKNGRLVEPEWRKGATTVSATCQAPIIPAALDAYNSRSYYLTRAAAQFLSGGNDNFGAKIGSLRYIAEFLEKLGGHHNVFYGDPLAAGTAPHVIKAAAESLVPGLYRSA